MISTGGHLTILESVDSTNNYAMARVRTGLAKHGDAFLAMDQVAGKGQRGNTWITERGANIIITLVMRPAGLSLQHQFQLSAAAALAAYDFYSHYAGDETAIKWPNDIYWRDRKAGGMLIENIVMGGKGFETRNLKPETQTPEHASISSNLPLTAHQPAVASWQWAIIGIGMNINQTVFPAFVRKAVSLKQITGKNGDVIELAKQLTSYIQNRYKQLLQGTNFLPEYNTRLYKRAQTVTLKKGSRVFEALIQEVNELGELVVVTDKEQHFNFGEVEWVLQD